MSDSSSNAPGNPLPEDGRPAEPAGAGGGEPPPTLVQPDPAGRPDDAAPRLDGLPYQVETFLGDGGMGRVYKAFDPRLKRHVALKLVRGDDPSVRERLQQEAQAQARIHHPHVCPVFEVGEAQGRPFIAMQYIDGLTLHQARGRLTTEQKVRVLQQAAEGVHEAHRQGLIHRDIKPGNVMVERTGAGDWHPYVMDFGLARQAESPSLTATGTILGTPAYLAPEQAAGRLLDRRSDVYSLGATLYDLLLGRPPFEGTSLEVLVQAISAEPVPPRRLDPSLPVDLETIVLKCLEKEPQRRYDSARALAEDLGRFLDGEPVLARPPNLAYRWAKRARKHKALFAVAGAALLAVAALAGWGIQSRRSAAERARLAQTFGQEVERVQDRLEKACLLPLHDTRRERARVQERMKWILHQMKLLGRVSYGPGNYALGRGEMALGDYRRAREWLEKSWRDERYQTPEVAYALGLSLARIYQAELQSAERIGDKGRREARMAELGRLYREPARTYLKRGGPAGGELQSFAEALLAFLDRDFPRALERARAASAQAPWYYRCEQLEGDVYAFQGTEANNRGDYGAALRFYGQAEAAYGRALAKGRSDEELYRLQGRLAESVMILMTYGSGESPEEWYRKGLRACDDALRANPDSGLAWQGKALLHGWWGTYASDHGRDTGAATRAGLAAAEQAERLLPDEASVLQTLGNAYLAQSETETAQGRDPRPWQRQAIRSFEHSLVGEPNTVSILNNLGLTYMKLGEYEMMHGTDPRPSLQKAVESYRKTAALVPDHPVPPNNLGLAWMDVGEWELARGLDPRPALDQSIESLRRALAINPNMPMALNNLGVAYLDKGNYEAANGLEPAASWEAALATCRKAAGVRVDYASPYHNIGIIHRARAEYARLRGGDPLTDLDLAEESLRRALAINPRHIQVRTTLAQSYRTRAGWEADNGRPPDRPLAEARALIAGVLADEPASSDALIARGDLELEAGEWAARHAGAPAPALARARTAFEQALASDPANLYARLGLGMVALRQAEAWLRAPAGGKGGAAEIRRTLHEGLDQLARALAVNPRDADCLAVEGALLLAEARLPALPAPEPAGTGAAPAPAELVRTAREKIGQALRINPLIGRRYAKELQAAGEPADSLIPAVKGNLP